MTPFDIQDAIYLTRQSVHPSDGEHYTDRDYAVYARGKEDTLHRLEEVLRAMSHVPDPTLVVPYADPAMGGVPTT